jgi:hypothetical protein
MGIDPGGLESQCHLTAYLNAHDFYFATTFSPTPVRVIDFGAGFGRNAFAFSELKDSVYCAIDAVEKSYCLQSLTLKYLYSEPHLLLEYTDSPGITKDQVTGFIERGGRAIHLPAWRLDLLPAHLFNVLMMVWVFHELNPRAARAVLDLIAARMPPRAIVYAQGGFHTKVHRINLDRSLRARNYARLLLLDGHTFDWDSLPMIRDVRLFRRQPPQKQRSRLGRLVHIVNSLLAGVPHKIYRALRPARQPAPKGPPQ